MVTLATTLPFFVAVGCQRGDSAVAGPSSLPTVAVNQGVPCGVERWSVKTLSDTDAIRLDFAPVATTIAALNALPARCSNLPAARSGAEEFHVYEVTARVSLVRHEDDRDYHVVLVDDAGASIVVEVVDPACSGASFSPFAGTLVNARASFEALGGQSLAGQRVRLRGVGFFDFDHGQTGRSRSCLELHPVLGVEPA
jgi:hypothetical protein